MLLLRRWKYSRLGHVLALVGRVGRDLNVYRYQNREIVGPKPLPSIRATTPLPTRTKGTYRGSNAKLPGTRI